MVGIPLSIDSSWALKVLGRPDSVSTETHPFIEELKFPSWHYRDVDLIYRLSDTVLTVIVRSPQYHTRRGIGVGSPAAAVLAAYGQPIDATEPSGVWEYLDPQQEMHFLSFRMKAGSVIEISFGHFLD